jgi:hypothetical protein
MVLDILSCGIDTDRLLASTKVNLDFDHTLFPAAQKDLRVPEWLR